MYQLYINDEVPEDGRLAFDLLNVLHALGPKAVEAFWVVSGHVAENQPFSAIGGRFQGHDLEQNCLNAKRLMERV